jgi:hypothetical protein
MLQNIQQFKDTNLKRLWEREILSHISYRSYFPFPYILQELFPFPIHFTVVISLSHTFYRSYFPFPYISQELFSFPIHFTGVISLSHREREITPVRYMGKRNNSCKMYGKGK